MESLSHPNIIKLIEHNQNGVYKRKSGKDEEVMYLVMELATGGELLDLLNASGRFSESVARYYFR